MGFLPVNDWNLDAIAQGVCSGRDGLSGAGFILLGLNGIRYLNDIKVSRFTITLGFAAIGFGLATLFGLRLPLLAIFLSLVGLSIIVRSLLPNKVDRKQNG